MNKRATYPIDYLTLGLTCFVHSISFPSEWGALVHVKEEGDAVLAKGRREVRQALTEAARKLAEPGVEARHVSEADRENLARHARVYAVYSASCASR